VTRQDEVLKDTLHRMAGRAGDAEPIGERLAERALRGADRRSHRRIGAGIAVAAVGVVAVSLTPVVLGGDGHGGSGMTTRPVASDGPTRHVTLPPNTAAELAVVRTCMVGDPDILDITADPASPGNMTGPGTHVADFRVLATYRDSLGRLVLLGSSVAQRTCSLDFRGRPRGVDGFSHQTANPWQPGLSAFTGAISLDEQQGDTIDGHGVGENGVAANGLEQHIAGRVRPDVARVTFTLPDGRTRDAAVSHGFFAWRIAKPRPVKATSGEKPLIVRAYDRTGRVLTTVRTTIDAELARP
jgi:hypothetical protein